MENRNQVLIAGALIGAVTGVVAAIMLTRRAERNNSELAITTGEGFKLGVMVIGLLRAVASLGDEEQE